MLVCGHWDIGQLQGYPCWPVLGLEPHVKAHVPAAAHPCSTRVPPEIYPTQGRSGGRQQTICVPWTPGVGTRDTPCFPQAPHHLLNFPLWVSGRVFSLDFWDGCYTKTTGSSNLCPFLPSVDVGIYDSPQALFSYKRWGQAFLMQVSSFLCACRFSALLPPRWWQCVNHVNTGRDPNLENVMIKA